MRTHAQIIKDAGRGKLRAVLAREGFPVAEPTIRSWERRPDDGGSIPSSYWSALAKSRVATLSELAAHAATRGVRAKTAEVGA